MNEDVAKKLIKTAYEQIRVVKLIQKGLTSPTDYYIKLLTK
jgi:hypothetical protein